MGRQGQGGTENGYSLHATECFDKRFNRSSPLGLPRRSYTDFTVTCSTHGSVGPSVRPTDPERQTKRRVRNIGAARVRPSFFRQRTNRKEGRKEGTGTAAAKQQRQGARGLERSLPRSTTGRCERAELSRGPSLPPSGLVLCPSVAVRPEWHADIRAAGCC